jgi:UDP-sugar transporter A1/2/3
MDYSRLKVVHQQISNTPINEHAFLCRQKCLFLRNVDPLRGLNHLNFAFMSSESNNQELHKPQPFELQQPIKTDMSGSNADLKWIALVALVFQNSGLAIAMRYTFVAVASERYLPSTAVLNAEIMKLCISLVACFVLDAKMSLASFLQLIHVDLLAHKVDWCKLTVPSVLYTLQNSLQYYSMSCLSAPVFQVLYQMKIITTAIFSVLILSKRLTGGQWGSIVALAVGVALVQLSQTESSGTKENSIAGLLSVVLGCCTSGFAGVYFEMVLKSSNVSIWMRNIQLSVIGIAFSAVSAMVPFQSAAACQ